MQVGWLLGAGIFGVTALGGVAYAGSDLPSPSRAAPEPVPSLVLSIRARALGLEAAPMSEASNLLGLEPVKAPSGAGSSRMPSATTEIARGVYLTVMPSCLPGVDERGLSPAVRRRAQPLRSP